MSLQADHNVQYALDLFRSGWNNHDVKEFSSAFFPDADFTNVFGVFRKGIGGIEEIHEPLFKTVWSQSTLSFEDIRCRYLTPGIISTDVRWNLKNIIYPGTINSSERSGLLHFIIMEIDSVWKIAVMHNMDLPSQASSTGNSLTSDAAHEKDIAELTSFLNSR